MLLNIQPWQKRAETKVFAGFRHILRRTYHLPNGAETDFEIKHEPYRVVEMPLEDFRSHVRSGKMTDVAGAYMGLEKLQLL